MQKAGFCNLIAKIWSKGLTKENVQSGFKSTGIFPVDETKYKVSRLDTIKLSSYNKWRAEGSPVNEENSPILVNTATESTSVSLACSSSSLDDSVRLSVTSCRSPQKHLSPRKLPFSLRSFQDADNDTAGPSTDSSSKNAKNIMKPEEILKLLEENAPTGYKYALTLVPKETDSLEKALKRRQAPMASTPTPNDQNEKQKRKRISMDGAVLTCAEYRKKISAKTAEKEDKAKAKNEKKRLKEVAKKTKLRKQPQKKSKKQSKADFRKRLQHMIRDVDSDEDELSTEENDNEEEKEHEEEEEEEKEEENNRNEEEENNRDKNTTPQLGNAINDSHPILKELDDHNIGKFFAVFWTKPKTYYWGKLLKVFAEDNDADADQVEIQFLKKVESSSDPSQVKWDWPTKDDVGLVDAKLCFSGPCIPNITDGYRKKSHMTFNLERKTMEMFHLICKNKC